VSLFCSCKKDHASEREEIERLRSEVVHVQRELRAAQEEFDQLHAQVTKRWRRALAVERNQGTPAEPPAVATPAPPPRLWGALGRIARRTPEQAAAAARARAEFEQHIRDGEEAAAHVKESETNGVHS
jgi:nucleotide-binding universal stress UspA family protein